MQDLTPFWSVMGGQNHLIQNRYLAQFPKQKTQNLKIKQIEHFVETFGKSITSKVYLASVRDWKARSFELSFITNRQYQMVLAMEFHC